MIPRDYDEFCQVVIGFAEIKGKSLSSSAIELYWRALQHWVLQDFKLAAEQLLRTCEFMPTPKDFEDLRKAGRMLAGEAWEKARKACGSAIQCGQVTHNGTCGDPLIDASVRALGGYGVIAMCDHDKLTFLERRFAEHYGAIQEATDIRKALPQIASEACASLAAPAPPLISPSIPTQPASVTTLLAKAERPPRPKAVPNPTHTQAELESFARRLAETGFDSEAIAKMLDRYGVTADQVRKWLSNQPPAAMEGTG
jgi:hypothetical protein